MEYEHLIKELPSLLHKGENGEGQAFAFETILRAENGVML